MDDGQWWVLRDGITLGPYGLEELRQYTRRGKLYADDLVSAAGETDWSPAGIAPALSDLFPKDGSEDATLALDPALRALAAMAATPVPARRSYPAESPLRGSTLPPRLPTSAAPPAVAAPVTPDPPAPAVPAPAVPAPAVPAPAVAAPAVPAPAVPAPAPAVTAPVVRAPTAAAAPPPPPRANLATGLVIGLVASVATLGIERVVSGPASTPAPAAVAAATPATVDAAAAAPARESSAATADAAATAARVTADAGARPAPSRAQCVGAAALAGVDRTRAMLRSFDELVRGASPPVDPFDYGALATACLTSVARTNDRSRAALDNARAAEALRVRREAEARQATRAQQWRAMAFTWDAAWRTRVATRSATYGCFDGGWGDERRDECSGEWRQRSPAVNTPVYMLDGVLTEPELQRRVSGATGLHPEAEQFCEVLDAVLGPQRLTVTCAGDDGSAAYDLWLPRELAVPTTGALAGVMVGDVLRVTGHGLVKREPVTPAGAERWTIEEVPATGVSIADHTRCCALTERTATAPR